MTIAQIFSAILLMSVMSASWTGTSAATEEQGGKEAQKELREFSVVYNDRALNAMSSSFVDVVKELHDMLTDCYQAKRAVVMPGSGTFAMEALARQVADKQDVLVIRNGYFSYRWTDIFEQGFIVKDSTVLRAEWTTKNGFPIFSPLSIEKLVAQIKDRKPAVVFAPHVETSTGMMLPDEHIKAIGEAARAVNGTFVLDGIAAGMHWVDMKENLVDYYITAPQKGWSGLAGAGIVMMGDRGYDVVSNTVSSSMALNLKNWRDVMETYLNDGYKYYTTLPTDVIKFFHDSAAEIRDALGWEESKRRFVDLGRRVRIMMESKGLVSVTAKEYAAPGVIVMYTDNDTIVADLKGHGIQAAAGVPFMLGESLPYKTFRIGLFGLEKVYDVHGTTKILEDALDAILSDRDVEFISEDSSSPEL